MTMQQYVGVKIIQATPEEKDGLPGYTVVYADGYTSWSPVDAFESSYQLTAGMGFPGAVHVMMQGMTVSRRVWSDVSNTVRIEPVRIGNDDDGNDVMRDYPVLYVNGTFFNQFTAGPDDIMADDWYIVE